MLFMDAKLLHDVVTCQSNSRVSQHSTESRGFCSGTLVPIYKEYSQGGLEFARNWD